MPKYQIEYSASAKMALKYYPCLSNLITYVSEVKVVAYQTLHSGVHCMI